MEYVIALLLSIALIVVGIVKWKIHPFFVLLLASICYGFLCGMNVSVILESIESGFGNLMGNIGLIIFFGVVLGTVLEKSGGAMAIAVWILRWIGKRSTHLAMLITGYFLSIPVFCDSGFIIMNPLNKAITKKAGVSYAGTSIALALGLLATHIMVPPTPGPIAVAGILSADIGQVILWGTIISGLSLIPCYFFVTKFVSRISLPIEIEEQEVKSYSLKVGWAFLPIVVPIILIVIKSLVEYPSIQISENIFYSFINFSGHPIIALLIGVALSLILPKPLDDRVYSSIGWFGEALVTAAPIILITGAGGIFGAMLMNSGIGEVITNNFSYQSLGVIFPFLLAGGLKTAQGSSTVAMITAASIMAPLITVPGLENSFDPVIATLAIGAGSAVVSHSNDSFFWVVTQLTGMDVKQGLLSHTVGSLVLGLSAISLIVLLTFLR